MDKYSSELSYHRTRILFQTYITQISTLELFGNGEPEERFKPTLLRFQLGLHISTNSKTSFLSFPSSVFILFNPIFQ